MATTEQRGFTWNAVKPLLEGRNRFVLATHVNADGDGLGAQLALYHFLRRRGKEARIVNTDALAHNTAFLDPGGVVERYDPAVHDPVLEKAEIIVLLDNSAAHRLGAMRERIERSPATKVCIDHHPEPDTTWDVMAIDPTASATGEMVYGLIREMDGDIPREAAEPIYVSIVTDTGNFRFSNTTPRILRIAAELVERGVSVPRVYQEIYERNSAAFTRLLGASLSEVRLERDGRLGYLVVSRELMRRARAEGADTSDIINHVLAIDGAQVAALFKEVEDRRTKVSLRSKGTLDVRAVAALFGGGGHRNASGIVMELPLPEVLEKVLGELRAIV